MDRKTRKLMIGIVLAILTISITTISEAGIEIKLGTDAYTNIDVSASYNACYNMRYGGSTLGTNSLDPHLTTNADWGAIAYLGLSDYGSVRSKDGYQVTIDGVSCYSTTNNATGVMNMGKNYTQTASLFEGDTAGGVRASLGANLKTKYVETLKKLMILLIRVDVSAIRKTGSLFLVSIVLHTALVLWR